MQSTFPSAQTRNPLIMPDGSTHLSTVFLNAAIDHPRWFIGDYSYASAHVVPDDWAVTLAPYLFPMSAEKLVIGKFCQIASGVQFITSSANHRFDGISSYPFAIFDGMDASRPSLPGPGADTVIGNDVWIGTDAKIMPGAHIGNGVIIGAGAVVTGHVQDYTIVGGNPAQTIRARFDDDAVQHLLRIAWWNWPIAKIMRNEALIMGGDVAALNEAS